MPVIVSSVLAAANGWLLAMLGIQWMPARGSGAGHKDASLREADARRLRRLRASKEKGTDDNAARVGVAFENQDGSFNLLFDFIPMEKGELPHVPAELMRETQQSLRNAVAALMQTLEGSQH